MFDVGIFGLRGISDVHLGFIALGRSPLRSWSLRPSTPDDYGRMATIETVVVLCLVHTRRGEKWGCAAPEDVISSSLCVMAVDEFEAFDKVGIMPAHDALGHVLDALMDYCPAAGIGHSDIKHSRDGMGAEKHARVVKAAHAYIHDCAEGFAATLPGQAVDPDCLSRLLKTLADCKEWCEANDDKTITAPIAALIARIGI